MIYRSLRSPTNYMAYLHEMKKQDLGVMSEFLLMAATLLDIKSRMLLPKEVNEEGRRGRSASGTGATAARI